MPVERVSVRRRPGDPHGCCGGHVAAGGGEGGGRAWQRRPGRRCRAQGARARARAVARFPLPRGCLRRDDQPSAGRHRAAGARSSFDDAASARANAGAAHARPPPQLGLPRARFRAFAAAAAAGGAHPKGPFWRAPRPSGRRLRDVARQLHHRHALCWLRPARRVRARRRAVRLGVVPLPGGVAVPAGPHGGAEEPASGQHDARLLGRLEGGTAADAGVAGRELAPAPRPLAVREG
mmetsp:Transcript_8550/g.28141  ORF Transcript_8550/g.28141 Transcript_8550/m.28141 type:complete len:236 (-) Transcript_8550:278-985(-)